MPNKQKIRKIICFASRNITKIQIAEGNARNYSAAATIKEEFKQTFRSQVG